MSDIDAMQGRIMAALDRIGQGLDGMSQSGGAAEAEDQDLRQQLEDEKLANAQLEERVKQLGARARDAEARLAEMDAAAVTSAAEGEARASLLKKVETDLQSLRRANQQLRDNNAKLREANAKGVAEPHLINKAMMAELDGLRASRAADRSEMDTILGELARIGNGAEVQATGTDATNGEGSKGMEDA